MHHLRQDLATLFRRGSAALPLALAVALSAVARPAVGAAQTLDTANIRATTPVVGLPCEGCEAVLDGLPTDPSATTRIGAADEPGEPLRIEGTVYGPDGTPAPGVIVYAYHTNAEGEYPRNDRSDGWAARHGRLRAWARTGPEGRYRFETIRPASYPNQTTPAHVHMHVVEPGCCTYYINSIHFSDDPLLDPDDQEPEGMARGGDGVVQPTRDADGGWRVERDIHLGRGVPGYPGG